jgi:hypothetical protein
LFLTVSSTLTVMKVKELTTAPAADGNDQ